jgi:beta-glucosidase-like glycosyl hydrolase
MAAQVLTERPAASAAVELAAPTAFGGLETREPLTEGQIDAIARGLLAELTLDEKISMMHGGLSFFEGMYAMNRSAYYRQPRTAAGAIPRLGIPGVKFSDGPRGFHGEGATTFPQGSARGARSTAHTP